MYYKMLTSSIEDWIWLPDSWLTEASTQGDTKSFVFNFVSFSYKFIITIALILFTLRFLLSIFKYFSSATSAGSAGLQLEQKKATELANIKTSFVGMILITIGILILRIFIGFIFPEYLWIVAF